MDRDGNVLITCNSILAVRDFLGVSRYKVKKKLENGESILWVKENRLVSIRELEK